MSEEDNVVHLFQLSRRERMEHVRRMKQAGAFSPRHPIIELVPEDGDGREPWEIWADRYSQLYPIAELRGWGGSIEPHERAEENDAA